MTRLAEPDFRLAEAARRLSVQAGPDCLAPERLLAFYSGKLPPAEEEEVREHLARCAACCEQARDAAYFASAFQSARASRPLRQSSVATFLAWAAGLFVVAGGTFFLLYFGPGGVSGPAAEMRRAAQTWASLEVEKAPYEPGIEEELVFRGEEAADSGAFAVAMEAYVGDDFSGAAQSLGSYLESHPEDVRAEFYRGVALLLAGEARAAQAPLARVTAEGGALQTREARWYLALAHLRSGEPESAAAHLTGLAATAGAHRVEARSLLARVHQGAGR